MGVGVNVGVGVMVGGTVVRCSIARDGSGSPGEGEHATMAKRSAKDAPKVAARIETSLCAGCALTRCAHGTTFSVAQEVRILEPILEAPDHTAFLADAFGGLTLSLFDAPMMWLAFLRLQTRTTSVSTFGEREWGG